MLAGRILGAVDALVLQGGEERLGHRVIIADSGTPDGMPDAVFLQRFRELLGRLVTTAIGAEDRLLGKRVIACGQLDDLLDAWCIVLFVRGSANHILRIAYDKRRQ